MRLLWLMVVGSLVACSKKSEPTKGPAVGDEPAAVAPTTEGTAPASATKEELRKAILGGGNADKAPQAGAPSALTSLPADAVRMQRAEIRDERGFGRPMVAANVFIPAGWKASGGIVWGAHGLCGADYAASWKVSAPDGVSSFAFVAAANWVGTRSSMPTGVRGPCVEAFHLTAREYLEAEASRMHPGARVLEYKALPEDAKPLRDAMAPPIVNENMRSESIVDAGELVIAYEENGREIHEALTALVFITHAQFADVMNPSQIGIDSISGFPGTFTISRAPAGKLDRGLRKRVASSLRFTPEWSKGIAAFNAQKMKNFADASAAGHAARMAAIRKTAEIQNGIYEDRVLTNDRMQRESIEAIRGVETYVDTDGNPVQLDGTYNHAWRANDGTYILTNDPSFNPSAYGLEAQQLEVAK